MKRMAIRRLSPKTQYQYVRHVKKFADFLGRSADKATAEDGLAEHKGGIARWRLKALWSKTAT